MLTAETCSPPVFAGTGADQNLLPVWETGQYKSRLGAGFHCIYETNGLFSHFLFFFRVCFSPVAGIAGYGPDGIGLC